MNNRAEKGNISFPLLLSCCFLTLMVSLISYFVIEQYADQLHRLRLLQLRSLAGSAIVALAQQSTLEEGTQRLGAVTLYPGKLSATLDYGYIKSSDNSFKYLYTRAATKQESAGFQKTFFTPSQELQQLAQSYGLIATYGITNSKYIPQGLLYTSNGNFAVPSLDLLASYGTTSLDLEDLHSNGGNSSFVLNNNTASTTRLTYASAMPITKGNLLLASRGNILLEKNFQASDRLILISDPGTITLEDNVTLNSALIISGGRLTIGKNCKINGILMCRDRISFQGNCNISQDANVVAPFASFITSRLE